MSLTLFVNIDTLTSKPSDYNFIANSEERKAIAKRLNLLSLEILEARLHLQRKDHIFLTGKITADVTQQCVRTLAAFPQHLDIPVNEIYMLDPLETQEERELETKDLIEPLQGNALDLGEVVIQLLSLNLDPYPVAPDSTPLDYQEKPSPSSPFEVLKKKE